MTSAAFTFAGAAGSLLKRSLAAATAFSATLDNLAGVVTCEWEIVSTDDTTAAASYTLARSGPKNSTVTSTSLTAGTAGLLASIVNRGRPDEARAAAKFFVPTTGGLEVGCFDEEFESDPVFGSTALMNAAIRAVGAGGGAGDLDYEEPLYNAGTVDAPVAALRCGVDAEPLTVPRRNGEGVLELHLDDVGETTAPVLLINNTTTSTLGTPQRSPKVILAGREASVGDRRMAMSLQVSEGGETSAVTLVIRSQLGEGDEEEAVTIDGAGAIGAASTTLTAFTSAPNVYADNVYGRDGGPLNIEVAGSSEITVVADGATIITVSDAIVEFGVAIELPVVIPAAAGVVGRASSGRLLVYVSGAARTVPTFADLPILDQLQKAADGSAVPMPQATVFEGRPYAVTGDLYFRPNAVLAADDTDFATINVYTQDGVGGSLSLAGTISTTITGGTGNWTAFAPVPLVSSISVPAGYIVTVEIQQDAGGAGVPVPSGKFVFSGGPT